MSEKASVRVTRGPNDTDFYLEGDELSVVVGIPTYDGVIDFAVTVERDADGDWRLHLPEVASLDRDRSFVLENGTGGVSGIVYLGAPD